MAPLGAIVQKQRKAVIHRETGSRYRTSPALFLFESFDGLCPLFNSSSATESPILSRILREKFVKGRFADYSFTEVFRHNIDEQFR